MKSDEAIIKLSKNPFYKLTDEEETRLMQIENGEVNIKKKASPLIQKHGNATVKVIGKLDKHLDDPVAE